MPLRLFDSFQRQKVNFEPLQAGRVSMYVCGPTTYAPAHIGHAYSAICFDLIRRGLLWLGYEVTYVRNVTDVDDKIIKRAQELGEDPVALAARFADDYNRDMSAFGVLAPTIEPKVSTHIAEIVALVRQLVEAGKAYASDGDVYFSVEAFPPYGKLSGQSLEDLRAGARVEVSERKRSPADFALWKAAKPGEPSWPSPWGAGRPGWHIECSAMSHRHLGVTFDIHGGGKDLVFPHHENEIAQSQGAFGEGTFARYWVHNGFLNFDGEKMSKSLGNVFGCDELIAAVGGEALRFYFVSHHYRSPIEFEVVADTVGGRELARFPGVEVADRRLAYFYTTLQRADEFLAQGGDGDYAKDAGAQMGTRPTVGTGATVSPGSTAGAGAAVGHGRMAAAPMGLGDLVPECDAVLATVRGALEDDFNAPQVVAALGEAAKVANRLLDDGKGLDKRVRRRSIAAFAANLRSIGFALGVLGDEPVQFLRARRARLADRRQVDVPAIEALLQQRTAARAAKDFAAADALRDQLQSLGVEVLDTRAGADWRFAEAPLDA